MIWQKFIGIFTTPFSRAQSLSGKNILVIDDGEIERKVYSQALESSGAKVTTAADGATGLSFARSQKWDLVLLDYQLPDTNGIEVCRQLKTAPETRAIPVLFLTGSVKPEGVLGCYEAGADCYLSKPIGAVTLVQQVRMTLLQEGRPV